MNFRRGARAPVVDLCATRDPQAAVARGTEQGEAERGVGGAEGHRLDAAPVIARDDCADMAVAHDIALDQPNRPGGDARRGPASSSAPQNTAAD